MKRSKSDNQFDIKKKFTYIISIRYEEIKSFLDKVSCNTFLAVGGK